MSHWTRAIEAAAHGDSSVGTRALHLPRFPLPGLLLIFLSGAVCVKPGPQALAKCCPPQFAECFKMDLALTYVQGQEYEKAAGVFRKLIGIHPESAQLHLHLASSYGHGREYAEAATEYRKVLRLEPKNDAARHMADASEAAYEFGRVLANENGAKTAQSETQQPQHVKKKSQRTIRADTLNKQGNQLMSQGKLREAVEAYSEAARLNPDDARTHYNLSLVYAEFGDRAAEQAELTQAVRLDPKSVKAHNRLGLRYMEDGKVADAEKEFKTALDINPTFAEAETNLGVLCDRQGKISEAEDLFRKAQKDDPQYAEAFIGLGLMLAGRGRLKEAEQEFQHASKISPESVYTALGTTEAKFGNWKEAAEIFLKVVHLRPTSVDARLNLGIALANGYDLKGALEQFSEAVRLYPGSPVARYNKGRVLHDMGRLKEGRAELEAACKVNPNYPAALYLLAESVRELGDLQRSTELLEGLVKLTPASADAQSLLGQNLLRLGRTDEAIEHLRLAVEADPENSRALYNLAQTLKKFGKPQAEQYLARFEELTKQRKLSDRVQQLGIFAMEAADARDWDEAIEDSKEALQLCGNCRFGAALHRNLGLIYCRKGDLEDGKRELEAALKLKPDDPDTRKALEIVDSLLAKPGTGN